MPKKYIFVNSHPIQYFAPLYTYLANDGLDIEVIYCSDETIKGALDKEFGVPILWDVPLLKGYKSTFVKNKALNKGIHNGFFGLMNFGIWKALRTKEKKIVIVPGWQFFSYVWAILAAKFNGHHVCIRVETPLSHKNAKKGILQTIKNGVLKFMLPKLVHSFLYIGEENKNYLKSFGVKESKLFFTPYSIDNERFKKDSETLLPQKEKLKKELNIPENKFVILYSGKYIDKKNPLDLLSAVHLSNNKQHYAVIFMGEGELREKMEKYVKDNKMENIILTGFINQTNVTKYYAVSNLFVMCSGVGETWGLSTNEAMNFGLPIVLSNLTGSSADLVKESVNGFVFETGNVQQLTKAIDEAYVKFGNNEGVICKESKEIVEEYSFTTIAKNLSLVNN